LAKPAETARISRCAVPIKGKVNTPGICALLGLKPFTPHDLRRTAASLAGDLGFDDAWIAKCLDHAASKKSEQIVPSVTGKVYNHSNRMKEKCAVLDGIAAEYGGSSASRGCKLRNCVSSSKLSSLHRTTDVAPLQCAARMHPI
jgi:hypothetical protein